MIYPFITISWNKQVKSPAKVITLGICIWWGPIVHFVENPTNKARSLSLILHVFSRFCHCANMSLIVPIDFEMDIFP